MRDHLKCARQSPGRGNCLECFEGRKGSARVQFAHSPACNCAQLCSAAERTHRTPGSFRINRNKPHVHSEAKTSKIERGVRTESNVIMHV